MNVPTQMTQSLQSHPDVVGARDKKLIEDMIRSLNLLLLSDSGLLEQVGDNVAASQFS